MSGIPQFASSPVNAGVIINAANANRDGTGTVGTVYTAPAGGARIDALTIKAAVTTTAGMVRLFLHNGVSYYLWREISIPAITASATAAAFETTLGNLGLVLQSGWSLRASTERAEAFHITVGRAGEF